MVYATPLRTSNQVLGALNLFSRNPRELGGADLMLVRALADVATLTILQQRLTLKSTVIRSQLQSALNSRIVIEQAKGIVSQGLDVSMDTDGVR